MQVGVTSRFKGLDLIECLKNYGWRFVTLYSNCKDVVKQRRKGKIYPFECRVPKNSKER